MASKFTITAELNLQTKNLNQVVNNLRQQFQGANLNIKIKDLAKTESQLRNIASSAGEASKESKLLGNSLNQAFKRFTVITAVTGTLVGFTRSLKKGVSEAIQFEREVVKIAQATGQTVSQLRGLVSQINKVSTSFGVSSQELVLVSRTLTQAGFAADKVAGALKVLAQTELAATFDSIQDTTEGAIALLNQFGREAQRTGSEVKFLEQSFSAINQVSKEFAVESSDIVTAIRTTGSAFESAGGSLNELIALFTSVRSTTRESAESIATGFRTIFTRVQRVDTINALRDLGIELQDAEGKFVGPIEAAKRLSVALQTIDPKDFRFNLVVEELGGFRQVSKVIPLIQQFAVTQKALNVAQGSSGSLAKDAATAQQSLAVQITKTREEFSKFIRDLVETSSFQNTVRFLLELANAFIRVADTIKPLVPLIAGFAAIKIGNALGVGLRSFASKGAAGRDVPIGFATGGLVPGSGNGDTVPAMLTPGEFVIRKSSVNKLGAENLARVNKYADGGKIEDQTSIGAAILEPGIREDSSYKLDKETKEKLKSNTDLYNKVKNKTWEIKKQGVSTKTYSKFRDAIEYGLSQGLEAAVSKSEDFTGISPVKLTKQNERNFLDTINEGSYGNMFEQILTFAKDKGEFDANSDPKRPFDFTNGLPKLLSGDFSDLNMRFVDAKASRAAASKVGDKIARELLYDPTSYTAGKRYQEEAYQSALDKEVRVGEKTAVKQLNQEQVAKQALRTKIADKIIGQKNSNLLREKFDSDLSTQPLFKDGKPTSAFSEIFNKAIKNGKTSEEEILNYIISNTGVRQQKAFGGFIEKFANGGFSSGTDTVPAMLTPGEFVVNKKSAQKIGYASLNRMNKVGKYASGGPVQYFANGTSGTGVTGGSQVLGISAGDIKSLVGHFGTTITEVEMRLDQLAQALINLGVTSQSQQVVGQKVVQQTLANARNLKDFDTVVKNTVTNVKNIKNQQQMNQKIAASSGSAQAVLDEVKLLKMIGKVDKGFVTTIEKMISSIIKLSKDGAAADKAVKQLGQQLTILGPAAANSIKILTEAAFNAARGGQTGPSQPKKQSTPQTPEQQARTQAVIGAARQGRMPEKKDPNADIAARLEKLSSGTAQGTTNLLLMSSAAESVIAQFSGLDEASKSAASAFGATIATYLAVGGQLKNLGVSVAQGLLKRSQEKMAIDKNSRAFNSNSNAVNKNTTKAMGGDVKGASGTVDKLTKGLEVFDAALVGFSVAMGLASAAAAYYNEIAQKSADEMADAIKKFKEDPGTISKETLVSKSSQAFTDAGAASSAAGLLNWKSMAAMAVGATAGAAGGAAMGGAEGSVLGPYGSIIGGVIGGLAGGLTGLGTAAVALKIEYEMQKKSMENAGKAYGQSVYALGKATNDAQNFLKDIDKKSDKQIGTQIDKTASQYQSSLALLALSQKEAVNAFGSIEQAPDALKQAFEEAKNSAKALRVEFDKMVAAQTSRKLQEINKNVGKRGFSASREINKFAESTRSGSQANIGQELLSNYSPKITQLENGGFEAEAQNLKNSLQSLTKIKAEESVLRLKQSMQEASIQILNQKIALEQELQAREAVVGSLNRELALKDAFENFKFSLEQGANSLTAMDAVFSGAVSGLKSNVADISTLDLSTPLGANRGEFEKALADISSIGPAGRQVSQNFAELQAVLPNLETQLNSIDLSSFGDPSTSGKAIDDLIGNLGIDKGGAVAGALKDSFSAAFSSKELDSRQGVGDPKKQIETVLSTFRDFAKNLGDRGKEVLDVLKSYETRSREIQDRILQSQQKELELRLQGLDSQKTLAQNIASARGKSLTLGESDQFRNERQAALAGNLGGNASGIGKELTRIRDTLKKGGIPDDVARGLQSKAKNLEMALGELADQSNRTSDIMSKIDEARAKRETITGAATKYAFGTQEEKAKTDEAFQALGGAFATGDIGAIPDELKGAVSGLLQEFKDIPLLGGMTGKQIEKELTARQFEQMGQTDIAQMVRTESSTPEEKLIQELKNTAESEAAARQAYLDKEAQIQTENNNALKENTNALRAYVANISGREGQLNQVQQQGMQTFGQRADVGQLEAEKKALEADKVKTEEKLKIVADLSTKLAESIDKAATTYITALDKGYASIGAKAGGAARGGLIPNDLVYRAGGGPIFQSRGTDTVPAMLTPGEFVMKKSAVDNIGVGNLRAMNYANGGYVPNINMQTSSSTPAINNNMEQFSQFMSQFQEMSKTMSGMTMTHTITVDGQLNIGGINGEQIATQIRDAIGNYVGEIVSKKINDFKGRAG